VNILTQAFDSPFFASLLDDYSLQQHKKETVVSSKVGFYSPEAAREHLSPKNAVAHICPGQLPQTFTALAQP